MLCTVTLFVDNKPFKAHKMVLSACSLFFRDMFLTDQTSTVVLKDVTEKQMRMASAPGNVLLRISVSSPVSHMLRA